MTPPHCRTHPAVELVCPCCEQSRRGRATSTAKATAARANGRKGGRPPRATTRAVLAALVVALVAPTAHAGTVWRVWCADTPRAGVEASLEACKQSTATINDAVRACHTEGGRIVVEAMLRKPGACGNFPARPDCECRFE
jgi:hypothetical protein